MRNYKQTECPGDGLQRRCRDRQTVTRKQEVALTVMSHFLKLSSVLIYLSVQPKSSSSISVLSEQSVELDTHQVLCSLSTNTP